MSLKPSVEEYLKIACQLIVDEFNETYSSIESKDDLKLIVNDEFNQTDICFRMGDTFKTKTYNRGSGVHIKHNNFIINVNYLKNYKSENGTPSSSKNWKEHKSKFDWLENEIREGNKGKRAFVIGWFNCIERLPQVIQLGQGKGSKPYANDKRLIYFPFLKKMNIPSKTEDLEYNYMKSYEVLTVDLVGSKEDIPYNCIFIGNKEDKFHFAIYY